MQQPPRHWRDIDPQKIDTGSSRNWIAVLPLGAHEQHGNHLPFETDTIIAQGIADRLSKTLPDGFPVTFLPAEPIGYSIEHLDFAGSKSLTYSEAIERWIAIGAELHGQGLRKLVLLNAHGGNSPLMTVAASELRARLNLFCVATSWTRFVEGGDLITSQEKEFGIHGGDLETSVMLALAPDQVDMGQVASYPSLQETLAQQYRYLRAYGPHAFGWKMQDLNADGVTGDASLATVEKGEAILASVIDGLSALLEEVHDADPDRLLQSKRDQQ